MAPGHYVSGRRRGPSAALRWRMARRSRAHSRSAGMRGAAPAVHAAQGGAAWIRRGRPWLPGHASVCHHYLLSHRRGPPALSASRPEFIGTPGRELGSIRPPGGARTPMQSPANAADAARAARTGDRRVDLAASPLTVPRPPLHGQRPEPARPSQKPRDPPILYMTSE